LYKFKQPEILYEESHEGVSNGIPFMKIEENQAIPTALFIGSAHDSDETNEEGETIVDLVMHMYLNASSIKEILSLEEYNKLREGLGFKPVEDSE
jgi:hypothetical protein